MAKCPYCPYETPEPEGGDQGVIGWQEVAHMQSEHPDIIRERLAKYGLLDAGPTFGESDN